MATVTLRSLVPFCQNNGQSAVHGFLIYTGHSCSFISLPLEAVAFRSPDHHQVVESSDECLPPQTLLETLTMMQAHDFLWSRLLWFYRHFLNLVFHETRAAKLGCGWIWDQKEAILVVPVRSNDKISPSQLEPVQAIGRSGWAGVGAGLQLVGWVGQSLAPKAQQIVTNLSPFVLSSFPYTYFHWRTSSLWTPPSHIHRYPVPVLTSGLCFLCLHYQVLPSLLYLFKSFPSFKILHKPTQCDPWALFWTLENERV